MVRRVLHPGLPHLLIEHRTDSDSFGLHVTGKEIAQFSHRPVASLVQWNLDESFPERNVVRSFNDNLAHLFLFLGLLLCHVYALLFRRRQLRLYAVCLPGCTCRPLPYFFGTVQNGAQRVSFASLTNRFFLLVCLYRAIRITFFES